MRDPKELYKLLDEAYKADEYKYYLSRLGEGMTFCHEKDSRRYYLINTESKEAWELVGATGSFVQWDAVAVEICSVLDMPIRAQRNAIQTVANYYFGIDAFNDGVACVSWTLQPDGRYYVDEDGFGMTDDDEITIHAFVDKKAHIVIPFQPMDKELKELYHKQAIEIARNIDVMPYICLNPDFTIPLSENQNLEAHTDKLRKVVYGMMLQFGAMALNPELYPEYDGSIGVLTAINPDTEHNLQLMLLGIEVVGKEDTYEVKVITSLNKKGEEPQGVQTSKGEMNATEICNVMSMEANVNIILGDLIESAEYIYTGKISSQE